MRDETKKVLVLDDQRREILWLFALIESRGYDVVLAANEKAARLRLKEIADGHASYALCIIDVMMATVDITELAEVDDAFFLSSRDAGLRLCEYARNELHLGVRKLPIIAFTARTDAEVKQRLSAANVPYCNRAEIEGGHSIRQMIAEYLVPLSAAEQKGAGARGAARRRVR